MAPRSGYLAAGALFFTAALGFSKTPALSGVVLQPAGWFASTERQGLKSLAVRPAKQMPVSSESLLALRSKERLQPRIVIVNQGAAAAEGILIRYDFALDVAPASNKRSPVWAVPFVVDERHIPLLKPGESKVVPLDPEILRQTLAQISAAKFTAVRLRFEAMLEPRLGDARPLQKISSDIELQP